MKVIYIYDPLCGWCYGFSQVIRQLYENYKEQAEFDVWSGGMIAGDRIGPIGIVAPYISRAYREVERHTGVKFGEKFLNDILKDGKAIFSSIPPSIALSVYKHMGGKEPILFAARLQKAIYYDGVPPGDTLAYKQIAIEFGLSEREFSSLMQTPQALSWAETEFKQSQTLKVEGYPTVFVEYKGKYYCIANGYINYSTLEKNFLKVLKKAKWVVSQKVCMKCSCFFYKHSTFFICY
ncbi:MAG: DsbA family protein, partial [Cytophagaceae bacterium]|nr:DsbA family protein [Cytophagaceae bacterium]MDW8457431.1 DsbA family protein [Cytophagaceae bacterium]